MYHELVYHLDLCILSYHLYAQTLIWPMDPYYEQMSRKGTDRRDNFMKEVRKTQPISGYNCPQYLDPIVSDYTRIDPTRPCFTKPNTSESWSVFKAPSEITNSIQKTLMVEIGSSSPVTVHTNRTTTGTDHLYCFEGKTGLLSHDQSIQNGLKSMMGFVLDEKVDHNNYDIHIVFRGSRSGSGERALVQGLMNRGNPDWVTNMNSGTNLVEDKTISKLGHCSQGFSYSIKTIIPQIIHSLEDINSRRKHPPRAIYVTGHSLGGALATLFASAVSLGNQYSQLAWTGNQMPSSLQLWPWERLSLITFGAPPVGGKRFHYAFNSKVYARRIVLGIDDVTREKKLSGTTIYHVGSYINLPSLLIFGPKQDHDPIDIRAALIEWVRDLEEQDPAFPIIVFPDAPWTKDHKNFQAVLNSPEINNDQNIVKASLGTNFSPNLVPYLGYLKETLGKKSSYKKSNDQKIQQNPAAISNVTNILGGSSQTPDQKLTSLFEQLDKITDEDLGKYLKFCVILDVVYNNTSLPTMTNNQSKIDAIIEAI